MESAIVIFPLILSLIAGYIHAKLGKDDKPIWPTRILVSFLTVKGDWVDEWQKRERDRKDFSFHEQYIAATVIWFFGCVIAFNLFTFLYFDVFPFLYKAFLA